MYEETKVKFDWKGFLIKFALLIIVIIIVVKLLPFNRANNASNNETFNSNIVELKDVGRDYFTTENLPTKEGDAKTITLEELEAIGKIKFLEDEDGKTCDTENSYIKAENTKNGYELEVHLVCGSNSDTRYVYLDGKSSNKTTTTTTTTTTKKVSVSNNTNSSSSTNNTSGSKKTSSSTSNNSVTYVNVTKPKSNTYSVIFNSNGGSSVKYQSVVKGKTATRPDDPSKNGYIFLGWYLNGNVYNFNSKVNGNIILIAKWGRNSNINNNNNNNNNTTTPTTQNVTNKVNKYTVYFNSNGGNAVASQTVNSGMYASKPSNPSRSNATFLGWYLNGTKYNFSTPVTSNITLIAKYSVTNSYIGTVYSAAGGNSPKNTITVNHKLAVPSVLNNSNFSNVRLASLSFVRSMSTSTDLQNYNTLHASTYEYTYVEGNSYTNTNAATLSTIGSATVKKSSSDMFDRGVTWTGNVTRECTTKYNNMCVYGIVYQAKWNYETIE